MKKSWARVRHTSSASEAAEAIRTRGVREIKGEAGGEERGQQTMLSELLSMQDPTKPTRLIAMLSHLFAEHRTQTASTRRCRGKTSTHTYPKNETHVRTYRDSSRRPTYPVTLAARRGTCAIPAFDLSEAPDKKPPPKNGLPNITEGTDFRPDLWINLN